MEYGECSIYIQFVCVKVNSIELIWC